MDVSIANKYGMQYLQHNIIASVFFVCIMPVAMQAAAQKSNMRDYAIDLPGHVLRFSLPEEIAMKMSPYAVEPKFNPLDPAYFRNGFRQVAGTLHEFKGPFWVGTIGSLKFHFMVQRREREYQDEIITIDGLDRYVRWKISIGNDAVGCVFSREMLNGRPAVRREWNTFDNPNEPQPENLEIFSLPLNSDMFLDAGFQIRQWVLGRDSWKQKAKEMKEAIKATIVLEAKPRIAR